MRKQQQWVIKWSSQRPRRLSATENQSPVPTTTTITTKSSSSRQAGGNRQELEGMLTTGKEYVSLAHAELKGLEGALNYGESAKTIDTPDEYATVPIR
ncbi:hypothetical protein AWZ03_014645 [Drosophila navojoa]|uniref:Uncharacterized protein n=1 Tax=Drosophila navojoa TaxID=7232 RepID=A0A484AQL1_DRONA|nr:hypothetical protein AWZ03_014645 [Drosophila navojoa]